MPPSEATIIRQWLSEAYFDLEVSELMREAEAHWQRVLATYKDLGLDDRLIYYDNWQEGMEL